MWNVLNWHWVTSLRGLLFRDEKYVAIEIGRSHCRLRYIGRISAKFYLNRFSSFHLIEPTTDRMNRQPNGHQLIFITVRIRIVFNLKHFWVQNVGLGLATLRFQLAEENNTSPDDNEKKMDIPLANSEQTNHESCYLHIQVCLKVDIYINWAKLLD